jgi:hypothetical protein
MWRDLGLSLYGGRPEAHDGNNLAAAGLTTIDSLGVTGGDICFEEYILLDSLVNERSTAHL